MAGKLIVNRDVLLSFLDQNGFDYTAVSRKCGERLSGAIRKEDGTSDEGIWNQIELHQIQPARG